VFVPKGGVGLAGVKTQLASAMPASVPAVSQVVSSAVASEQAIVLHPLEVSQPARQFVAGVPAWPLPNMQVEQATAGGAMPAIPACGPCS